MRSGVVLLLVSTACGRIGFDPNGGTGIGDGGGGDGGGDTDGGTGVIVEDECTEPGLVLYLAFDEREGTIAADSSVHRGDGELVRFGENAWVPGRFGNALRFDGVDDYVDVGSRDELDDVRPLTVCAWIRLEGFPAMFGTIVDKSLDGYSEGWNFYLRDNEALGMYVHTDAFVEGGMISTSVWQHVCGAWDNTTTSAGLRLYRDGVELINDLVRGGTVFSSDAPHPMSIGRSAASGMFPFQGLMDELRIYDHAMNAAAVRRIMDCTLDDPS